jgi:general secretion pathway protein B
MSYILEALKKSDKERQRDEIPDIQADHSLPVSREEGRQPPVWRSSKAVIFGLAAITALFWWIISGDSFAPVAKIQKEGRPVALSRETLPQKVLPIPVKSTPVATVVKENPVKKELKEIPQPENPSSAPVAIVKKKSVSPLTPAPARIITPDPLPVRELSLPPLIDDLPVAIQAGIPDLTFAGHVYSEIPAKRLIIINNRIVREGDLISSGLSLQQIDSDGVVLIYEKSVFRVKLF